MHYPVTPDGRYFLVKNKLWRCTNLHLPDEQKAQLTKELMDARRAVHLAQSAKSPEERAARTAAARANVDKAKVALGERGPVWWTDGAPDYNQRAPKNTPYAAWAVSLQFSAAAAPAPVPVPGQQGQRKHAEKDTEDKGAAPGDGKQAGKKRGRASSIPDS